MMPKSPSEANNEGNRLKTRASELAREIVDRFVSSGHIYDEEFIKVQKAITKAINKAVAEEREACAKVAMCHVYSAPSKALKLTFRLINYNAERIAKAIRARGAE